MSFSNEAFSEEAFDAGSFFIEVPIVLDLFGYFNIEVDVKYSLSVNNSTLIECKLSNPLKEPVYVNDAEVSVTILNSDGSALDGESWPVSLPYAANSDGTYRESFNPFPALVVGEIYTIRINASGSGGLKGESNKKLKATNRTS